jgi:hypothetical protein
MLHIARLEHFLYSRVHVLWWIPLKNMKPSIKTPHYSKRERYGSFNNTCGEMSLIPKRRVTYSHDLGISAWLIDGSRIGFDALYTLLETKGNYSAVADLHILQFTAAHTLVFSVFTSRILATDFNIVVTAVSLSLLHTLKSSLYSLIHFLPFLLNYSANY